MLLTTSIKLPTHLKAQISRQAQLQGKTSHALMLETLELAMIEAEQRQQWLNDGMQAYEETQRTNQVYPAESVFAYLRTKTLDPGSKLKRPEPAEWRQTSAVSS
jgi:predicted transcriptional regulator